MRLPKLIASRLQPRHPRHLRRGQQGEDLALRHLRRHGLRLLQRNYRSRWGEIDLVMNDADSDVIVFVEVRLRARSRYASPAETIGRQKRRRLTLTAQHYLQSEQNGRARFDVIAITTTDDDTHIEWIKDAFQEQGAA